MPSPVGHALGGLAFGWLAMGASRLDRPVAAAMLFATLGPLADADLVVGGAHRAYSHSVGAIVIVALAAGASWGAASVRRLGLPPGRLMLACAAAYGSHVLFDWMAEDWSVPVGIAALWPFSDTYYQSSLHWFPRIERAYWLPSFWMDNLRALFWEVATLGPALAFAAWWRARVTRTGH